MWHPSGMFKRLDTVYTGRRRERDGACVVFVDLDKAARQRRLIPGPSQAVWAHAGEFNWGYGGSGPAQLALALLLDLTQDRELAVRYYQGFKWQYVSGWDTPHWQVSGAEIAAWLRSEGAAIDGLLPT